MVLGNGDIVTCGQCEPAYYLEAAEEGLPLDDVLRQLDELADTTDHFEFCWFPHTSIALTKRNTRLMNPPAATLFDQFLGVRDQAGPAGIFRNHYLDRVLGRPAADRPAGTL